MSFERLGQWMSERARSPTSSLIRGRRRSPCSTARWPRSRARAALSPHLHRRIPGYRPDPGGDFSFASPPMTARRAGRTAGCALALSSWSAIPSRQSTASEARTSAPTLEARGAIARRWPDNIVQITANFRSRAAILNHINRCFTAPLSAQKSAGLRRARADARPARSRSAVRRQNHHRSAAGRAGGADPRRGSRSCRRSLHAADRQRDDPR